MAAKKRSALGLRNGAHTHPERRRRGEDHGVAKLTGAQVIELRKRFAAGETSHELGAAFGMSFTTVCKIVSGQSWSHVGGPRTRRGHRGSQQTFPKVLISVESKSTTKRKTA